MDMFVWTSGSYNPLAYTHFNMFVDEGWTNANESPVKCLEFLDSLATDISRITLGNAISISVVKIDVFFLFCNRLAELVELGEFN